MTKSELRDRLHSMSYPKLRDMLAHVRGEQWPNERARTLCLKMIQDEMSERRAAFVVIDGGLAVAAGE